MEDDFDLLSEAICELLEQRLRETPAPRRHSFLARAIADEDNQIEIPEEIVYRLIEAEENDQSQSGSKPLSKRLH